MPLNEERWSFWLRTVSCVSSGAARASLFS
ncbi:hypothetical protein M8C21_009309 [Ambrosia artemisiifolia]|uniref:Uncharacterized protein n=1 Tax=Ambrosia artemisiifolia TaxID=4212 RepID=A0AAD5CUF4_AMBAR|nr:hypothetical protein M8C21_009309 [Ambrosia artemisiifolia]